MGRAGRAAASVDRDEMLLKLKVAGNKLDSYKVSAPLPDTTYSSGRTVNALSERPLRVIERKFSTLFFSVTDVVLKAAVTVLQQDVFITLIVASTSSRDDLIPMRDAVIRYTR